MESICHQVVEYKHLIEVPVSIFFVLFYSMPLIQGSVTEY
jgi:hypothetical protein